MSTQAEVDGTSPKRCLQTYAQGTLLEALAAVQDKAEVDGTNPKRCLQTYARGTLLGALAAGSNQPKVEKDSPHASKPMRRAHS